MPQATEPALQELCFTTGEAHLPQLTHTQESLQAAVKAQHNQLNDLKKKNILCDR